MGTREEEELIPALVNGSVAPMTLSEAMARQAGLPSPDRVGWYPRPGTEAGYSPSEIPPGMINLDARSVHNYQNLFVANDTGSIQAYLAGFWKLKLIGDMTPS